jgi:glycosyltransferase involved in cell wall biosynthesis
MRRVLYIHHGGEIGGAPLSLLYLLRQLDRSRYEPIVATLKPGPVVALYQAEGIETHVVTGISDFSHTTLEWYGGGELWRLPGKALRFWPSVRRARQLVERIGPDLVHLNSSTLAAAAIGSARAGVPVVWHIREPLAKGYIGLRKALLRGIIDRRATRIIAISHHDASQLIPTDRIRVIHNFVDFDVFDRALDGRAFRNEMDIPEHARVVTMLGGVARPKGTLTFVRAMARVREAVPDAVGLIVGPGLPPAESGLKALAKRLLGTDAYAHAVARELSGQEDIHLTGIRQDVPEILAASDVLAFPSSVPHFARPVIEAAAMSKPAVASDLGGPQELIVNGETGLLIRASDPEALAVALIRLLDDPSLARSMGESAYRHAREHFNAERNAAETIAIYEEVLEKREQR